MQGGGQQVRSGAAATELVVDGVRRAILDGDMSPGQRLVEAELMDMFGVTRGSVRSAIEDLTADGLVEKIPNRGARVRRVSLDEAVAILECRGVLEGLIAARAAERVTSEQAERLERIGEQMQDAVRTAELRTYARLNSQLHELVAEIGAQQIASGLILKLRSQIVRHQFQLSQRPGRPQVSLGQHLAIIEGVNSRDPQRAEQAARRHVQSVIETLLEIRAEQQDASQETQRIAV
ncbi:GntR family transcriptional regulator [Paenarthrobacter sp. TYUT067]|uniref:GntR family transcriptional regulator n=1 Tax=Paenarthrobacter sp. TYUT067 TaxID=2926245 RepID=UPI00203098EE|nr:GntR family transcriptional regulator [Paenarthrobacter sp. TYUT067]MCM0614989.1 GntR family transcriptional regulator [Paenarthrobacter sp. TYUT067]